MGRCYLKLGALGGGCYLASLAVCFVLTVILAGVTESWGAARAERVVLGLWASVAGLFLLSAVVVGLAAWRLLPAWSARLAAVGSYLVLIVPTVLVVSFLVALIFNR